MCLRFLRNGSIDFDEIFRGDVLSYELNSVFLFFEISLPVGKYGRFSVFKKSFCPAVFSKTVKDRVMKFSGMIDLSIAVCDWGLSISTVTSGRHRKWKKKSEFSKLFFQIKTYTIWLSLFSNVQNSWPHRKLKRQLPVIWKRSFKFSIFNALNLLYR